jgi:aspartate aminotransferase
VVTCGAKQALYNAMQALLEPGDRVAMQAPYWVSYPDQAILAGAEPLVLPMQAGGFGLNREALAGLTDERLRLIVLNSPSNPTGHVLGDDDLDAVAELVRRRDLTVICDDIYDKLVFDGRQPPHLLRRHPDLADRTLVVNGLSKTYSMTGWRLGWALGPATLIGAMRKIQDQSTSNATTFVQHAGVTALRSGPELVAGMLAAFTRRRTMLVEGLNGLPGVTCALPDGAFYAFPSFSSLLGRRSGDRPLTTTIQLAEELLERERVAVVPGDAFGAPGYLRFSFACSQEDIVEAVARVGRFLTQLR